MANMTKKMGAAKPRRDTRWKPGQSGNPRGRPKKPSPEKQAQDILRRVLEEPVGMRNGKPLSAFEATARTMLKTTLEDGRTIDAKRLIEFAWGFGVLKPPPSAPDGQALTGVLLVEPPIEDDAEWERLYGEPSRHVDWRGPKDPGDDSDSS